MDNIEKRGLWNGVRMADISKLEEQANSNNMSVAEFFRYLVAKERELTNEIERIRRREKRTTISEREKEAFRYFVAKERKEREK